MGNHSCSILICDDDAVFQLSFKQALKKNKGQSDFIVRSAYNADEAASILKSTRFDILVLDVQMRTADEGVRAIPTFRKLDAEMAIIMSSSLTDFKTVREAMRLGAFDYVAKDFDPDELAHTIYRVLEQKRLRQRAEQQNTEIAASQNMHVLLGNSPAVQKIRRLIEKAKATQASVVITGETGSGKEVVARQFRRTRSDGTFEPFVAIDSSTIQGSLAESILFGHEKGAFTGASSARKGIFEEGHGGVVYFDEIGNMQLGVQAKLLRVLQEREIVRVGSTRTIKLDFRLICATNLDLEEQVDRGLFKGDLFQRINVLPLEVPPLRERKEDIPLLIEYFSEREMKGSFSRFNRECLNILKHYSWPGNVRELENAVAYLVTITDGSKIEASNLPQKILETASKKRSRTFYEQVAEFEKRVLQKELEKNGHNISRLAKILDMDRSHIYTKIKKYGI